MRALVVDPRGERTSLGAVRALAKAGWWVGIAGPAGRGGAASRHCRRVHSTPVPESGLEAFRDALNHAIALEGYEVLLPTGDAEVLALVELRETLNAIVPYGDTAAVRRALDKLELAEAARAAGLQTPRTMLATSPAAAHEFPRPMMVKPRMHDAPSPGGAARFEAVRVSTADEAALRVRAIQSAGGEALLQEIVDGPLIGFVAVTDDRGEELATLQHVSRRIWPRSAGSTVRAETVPVDQGLAESVRRLLAGLEWRGLAMLDLFIGSDGAPRLIDLNGRLYACIALAERSGVNVAAMWAASATSRPVSRGGAARPGVRFQWLEGDLRLAAGQRGWSLLGEAVGCLGYATSACHSVWSVSDPQPALRRTREVLAQEGRRLPRLLGSRLLARGDH